MFTVLGEQVAQSDDRQTGSTLMRTSWQEGFSSTGRALSALGTAQSWDTGMGLMRLLSLDQLTK